MNGEDVELSSSKELNPSMGQTSMMQQGPGTLAARYRPSWRLLLTSRRGDGIAKMSKTRSDGKPVPRNIMGTSPGGVNLSLSLQAALVSLMCLLFIMAGLSIWLVPPDESTENILVRRFGAKPTSMFELKARRLVQDPRLTMDRSSVSSLLHEDYAVPLQLLKVMSADVQFRLRNMLRNRTGEDESSIASGTRPMLLVVQLVGELGGRLGALGSAMAYAHNTERVLVVLWEIDSLFTHPFRSVFSGASDLKFIPVDELPRGFRMQESFDDWTHFWFSFHDFIKNPVSVIQQRRELSAMKNIRRHLYVRTDRPLLSDYASSGLAKELLGDLVPLPIAREAVISATKVGEYKNITSDYAGRILHDAYSVPYDFILHMSGAMRKRLLDQISDKEATRPHIAPRLMFVHLQYGLGNRIRALGSAMAFAAQSHRVLIIIWESDAHLQAEFSDFFLNDFVVISRLRLPWPIDTRGDVAYNDFRLYNLMKKENAMIKSASSIVLDNADSVHIYVKTAYVLRSTLTGEGALSKAATSPISLYARRLLPVMRIQKVVERQLGNGLNSMIGVHIRGRTIDNDIVNVNAVKEYTKESSQLTNYWRQTTQLPVFIEQMRTVRNSSQSFFVAADSTEALFALEREFPGRVFFNPRNCDDRSAECLSMALADILCLSRTRYLLGSYWSSFTEAALRLGGIKVYLAGKDFGMPKKPIR
uniref:Uncharacterized protein n=1 Tax=Compsopogon caeruleus TaxID=31354 RepID=A0A7S1XCS5_9RHOD